MAQSANYKPCGVGDVVYKPFEILNPGVITEIVEEKINKYGDRRDTIVRVKFLKPSKFGVLGDLKLKVQDIELWYLQDFDYATEEHLKKYNKFIELREKAKRLLEEDNGKS